MCHSAKCAHAQNAISRTGGGVEIVGGVFLERVYSRRIGVTARRFMKIATYNVNGIRSRLSNLLEWLEQEKPDVACLQELKAPDEAFPSMALETVGYRSVWHGQKSWNGVAILARGSAPVEIRRGLPGGGDDSHSRYIEANVNGVVIGSLYLPNGNPQPGPKFEY